METKLEDILREKKPAILKRWFDAILETYPAEVVGLMKGQKNQFTGPVEYTIHEGIDGLIDGLIRDVPLEEISSFLDGIIKVRAVQDFSPSQAVGFIFYLKTILSEELKNISDARDVIDAATMSALESKIDTLALMSFDIYMKSREKIYELKVNEEKSMVFRLLQKEQQLGEMQGQGLKIETSNLK